MFFMIFFLIIFNIFSNQINLVSLRGYDSSACMIGEGLFESLNKFYNVNQFPSRDYHIKGNINNNLISIFGDVLWYKDHDFYKNCPDSKIKIAYSMFESSILPEKYIEIINNCFDAVIVPDNFLVNIYKNSGINKPIFVIPLYIADLNNFKQKENYLNNSKFTFLSNSGLHPRKGIEQLIDGFILAFKDNLKYELALHISWVMDEKYFEFIKNKIKNIHNIKIDRTIMRRKELFSYYSKFDCFIAPSGGEGFSLTPREAMASALPLIVLNYGVQKTIVNSNLVLSLESDTKIDINIPEYNGNVGFVEVASALEISKKLLFMVNNYNKYIKNAKMSAIFIRKINNLIPDLFKNLLSPKNIELTNNNIFTKEKVETNSKYFLRKMREVKRLNSK